MFMCYSHNMKRFLAAWLLYILIVSPVFSAGNSIKFDGKRFVLRYKAQNELTQGFINEYFKPAEKFETWSEMIAIHSLPNENSYKKQVEEFKKYLVSIKADYSINEFTEETPPVIDFIVVSTKKYPTIVEFNVFKYVKDQEGGLKAVQYAKRYLVKTAMDVDLVKEEIKKEKKHLINKTAKLDLPQVVVTEEAQKKLEQLAKKEKDATVYLKNENSVDYFIKPPVYPVSQKIDKNNIDLYFTGYQQYDKQFIIDTEAEYIKEDPVGKFFL